MQHKDQRGTSGLLGHSAHVHSWKRSQMTQVKLASGWPPVQHFHFSKILSPAHFDLSHDSPLKLDFFFKPISVVFFVSYFQVGFHCVGGVRARTQKKEFSIIFSVDSWLTYLSLVYS